MAKNKISDLRDHLFETIEMLKDPEKPLELERARAICNVAQTIINAAKVEVDLVEALDGRAPGSRTFFELPEAERDLPRIAGSGGQPRPQRGMLAG